MKNILFSTITKYYRHFSIFIKKRLDNCLKKLLLKFMMIENLRYFLIKIYNLLLPSVSVVNTLVARKLEYRRYIL